MNHFLDVTNAAARIGVSLRTFNRLAHAAGVDPLNFGTGRNKRFKYTEEMIQKVIAHKAANPPGRKSE